MTAGRFLHCALGRGGWSGWKRGAALLAVACLCGWSAAAVVVSREIVPGASATLHDGKQMFLQVRVPSGPQTRVFLLQFLSNENDWRTYARVSSAAIPFSKVKRSVQRDMLLAVFPQDYVDEAGWHHTALAHGTPYRESLTTLSEWLTGKPANAMAVRRANNLNADVLAAGQRVLFPKDLLYREMQTPTPSRIPKTIDLSFEDEPELTDLVDLDALGEELTYTPADRPRFAVYSLKKGEALYTSVVVRFTDLDLNEGAHREILAASDRIARASGIKDVHHMQVGQKVLIPVEMLADRFKPRGSEGRQDYEEAVAEAKKLKGAVKSRDLEGIVVILDPGHGGRDHGAKNDRYALYEDELNYDIMCRVKRILESTTEARTYVTMLDPNQGYEPAAAQRFSHDTDEVVLTTPQYRNMDSHTSANLRWILVNQIYRQERARGVDPMKTIFISIHTDSLFNTKLRGSMVYIPGARHRKSEERAWPFDAYDKYVKETSELKVVTNAAERRRDEALSRNFAETLLRELGKNDIKRHSQGDPVRSQILQDGGKVYVPAVLRSTLVPTKVLVETANLRNETDCERLRSPEWRQRFAEALVSAIRQHFGA